MTDKCPCGSGKVLSQCCGPCLDGTQKAVTAEALMRSRYSAYVLGNADYLRDSWHPSTVPAVVELDNTLQWRRLQVLDCEDGAAGDHEGVVEFVAQFEGGSLHERSRFRYEAGRWYYLDGELFATTPETKTGRNAPCPCGSGKKFKRCCGG